MEIIISAMVVIATAIMCGLAFRIRGGLWNNVIETHIHWGSTTARLVAWALPTAVLGTVLYSLSWYWMPALWLAAWLGCLQGWYHSIDMGRNEGSWSQDFVLTSLRGVLWTLPISLVFAITGTWPPAVGLLLCGAAMGIWYEAGWRTPSKQYGFHQGPELGELYFGLMFGLTLSLLAVL